MSSLRGYLMKLLCSLNISTLLRLTVAVSDCAGYKEITTTTGYHIIPESSHLNKKKKRKKRSIIIIIKKGIEQSNFSYREAKIK